MSSNKLSAAIFVINLFFFFFVTFSGACDPCKHKPKPPPAPSPAASCPIDKLKLGVCVELLGVVTIIVGTPPSSQCCALIKGLADLEAALCLCTAIKANLLGINLNVPIALSAIISGCGKIVPSGFQCT